jgi:WD40 repeat protein
LRSLISSPEPHIVYYPSGNDVVALNTETHEREIITTLPFPPRCLTASKDWVCIGGEQGNYTAVSLNQRKGTPYLSASLELDADARLPLDLDHRTFVRESTAALHRSRAPVRPITAKAIRVGTEIVNCVTLWYPTKDATEKAYQVPVAVVSNNDCTVSILNLENSEVLQQLTMPDYVNRSVISPNGALLATISDDPFLYIHERQKKQKSKKDRWTPSPDSNSEYEWALLCRIQLEGQRPAEKSEMRGSFAVCFSKSGKYLAVATQYGVISVFDVETITDTESLVAVFTTSRPSTGTEPLFHLTEVMSEVSSQMLTYDAERDCGGAVRAMEFSPGLFDLLAWTESTGRVGVADVRTLFFSRQLLMIDHNSDAVERIHITERAGDPVIDPRLRSFRTESPSSSTTPDYLGLDFERRQLRHLTREMLDRHQAPLTAEELEVLQAHRIARRQRDAANAAREALAEASSLSRWAATTSGEGNDRRMSSAGLPAALREFVNPDRTGTASFRSFINERNQDRERRSQLQQEPRRRGSVMLAAAESAIERETLGSSGARNGNDAASSFERLTLTPRQATESDSPNNPWAEIDALYRSRFQGDPPPERSTRLRIELEDEDRRDFAHRLRQPWRPLDDNSQINPTAQERQVLSTVTSVTTSSGSVETMGCCWSDDGRIL